MNVKALIPLVAGLGIGGVALVLGVKTLKNAQAARTPAARLEIWAAKDNIRRGTQIREEMLQAMPFPAELAPEGAFKKKEKLIGRVPQLVAPGGLPILESMLSPPGTKPGIFVKPGYRAVAVKIDAGSGVDYHLEPGCSVDVVGSFKVRRGKRTETIAKTIVENVELAAVGPRLSPATGDEEDAKDRARAVRAVTLFVKPDEVPKLLLTEQQGRIKLSLRGNQDGHMLGEQDWVSDRELMGEVAEDEPDDDKSHGAPLGWFRGLFAKPPAEPAEAEVAAAPSPAPVLPGWILRIYRGDEEEIVQFKSPDSPERFEGQEAPAVAQYRPPRNRDRERAAVPPAQQVELNAAGDGEDQGDALEPEELMG